MAVMPSTIGREISDEELLAPSTVGPEISDQELLGTPPTVGQELKEFSTIDQLKSEIDHGEFNPLDYSAQLNVTGAFDKLPADQQDKLIEAYRYQASRGVTKDAVVRAIKQVPTLGKNILLGLGGIGKRIFDTASSFAKGDDEKFYKSVAEIGAAIESGGLDTVTFARGAVRKLAEGAPGVDALSTEEIRRRFFSDLGLATQRAEAVKGQGALAESTGLDAASLKEQGIELDTEAIENMSIITDPTNFIPAAGGLAIVNKLGKRVGFVKGVAKAEQAINKITRGLSRTAGKVAAAPGASIQKLGQIAKSRGAQIGALGAGGGLVATAMTGDPSSFLKGVAGAVLAPTIVKTGGELLEQVGKQTRKAGPLAERVAEFTLNRAVKPAAAGSIVGGTMAVPLALLAENDDAASSLISGGIAFGGILHTAHRGAKDAGQALGSYLAEKYQSLGSRPRVQSPGYGNPLDEVHAKAIEELAADRPADANVINQVREAFREINLPNGRKVNAEIYLVPEDVKPPELSDEQFAAARPAGFWSGLTPEGKARIYLFKDAMAVFHEPGHLIHNLIKVADPEAAKVLSDQVSASFPAPAREAFREAYEKRLYGDDQNRLSEQMVISEIVAESFSNMLRGHSLDGLPAPFRQRIATALGGFLEVSGLYEPGVKPAGTSTAGPLEVAPSGFSPLGVGHSFSLSKLGIDFLSRLGVRVPDESMAGVSIETPAAPKKPLSTVPVEPRKITAEQHKEDKQLRNQPPVLSIEPGVDSRKWAEAEALVKDPAELESLRALRAAVDKPQGEVGPVRSPYFSVIEDSGQSPVERSARRMQQNIAAIREDLGTVPEDLREMVFKTHIPNRVIIRQRSDGTPNINIVGTSVEKIFVNATLAAREAAKAGVSLPIETKNGKITKEGHRQLFDALTKYTQNQMNGYAGDGSKVTVPQGYEGDIPPVNRGYTPRSLEARTAQFINLLQGIEPPRTTRRMDRTKRFDKTGKEIISPRNIEAVKLARASRRLVLEAVNVKPVQGQRPVFRETGETIKELNPLRDEFAQKGVDLSKILHESVEELSLEHFGGVIEPIQSPLRGVSTPLATAGFMPREDRPTLIRGVALKHKDGRVFKGTTHAQAFNAGIEAGAWKENDVSPPVTTGFILPDGRFISEDKIGKAGITTSEEEAFGQFMPKPGEHTEIIRKVDAAVGRELEAITNAAEGKLTGLAYDIGLTVRDEGGLERLKELRKKWEEEARRAVYEATHPLNIEKLDAAAPIVAKAQFFREALEAATGSGSAKGAIEQFRPGIKPPFEKPEGDFMPAPEVLDEIKFGKRDGVTLNKDGSEFDPGERKLDVVTVASKDIPVSELSFEALARVLEPFAAIIDKPDVRPGIFRISRKGPAGEDLVSIDVNAIVDQKHRDNTAKFAADNNQESFFDLVTFETVASGGDGRTRLTNPDHIAEAIDSLVRGEPVNIEAIKNPTAHAIKEAIAPLVEALGIEPIRRGKDEGSFMPEAEGIVYRRGWLDPDGKFYALPPSESTHETFAEKYLQRKGEPTKNVIDASTKLYKRGWLRFIPMAHDSAMVNSFEGGKLTRAQRIALEDWAFNEEGLKKLLFDPGGRSGPHDVIFDSEQAFMPAVNPSKEFIKEAALRTDDGEVFTGPVHYNIWEKLRDENRSREVRDEGFITNTGRFVNRDEAFEIAEAQKQFRPGVTRANFVSRRPELIAEEIGKPETDFEAFMPKKKKLSPSRDLTSKGWILPDDEFVPLGAKFHHDYLSENAADLNKRFKTKFDKDTTPDERIDALNKGFTRINYERNTGTLHVETNKKFWNKRRKDTVFETVADNLDDIDNMLVNVVNDDGTIADSGYARLFNYDDADKLNHLPLISEEGAFMPRQKKIESDEEGVAIYELSVPGSKLTYEQQGDVYWVLNVETKPKFQQQGKATELLNNLFRRAQGKVVNVGAFTEEGRNLRGLIARLAKEYRVRVPDFDRFEEGGFMPRRQVEPEDPVIDPENVSSGDYWLGPKGFYDAHTDYPGHEEWVVANLGGKKTRDSIHENYERAALAGFHRVIIDSSGIDIGDATSWERLSPAMRRAVEDVAFNRNLPILLGGEQIFEAPREEGFMPRRKESTRNPIPEDTVILGDINDDQDVYLKPLRGKQIARVAHSDMGWGYAPWRATAKAIYWWYKPTEIQKELVQAALEKRNYAVPSRNIILEQLGSAAAYENAFKEAHGGYSRNEVEEAEGSATRKDVREADVVPRPEEKPRSDEEGGFMPRREQGEENITESALRFGDQIFSGRTHIDAAEEAIANGFMSREDMDNWGGAEDGFLTNTGRFVDREEAYKIAKQNKQLKREEEGTLLADNVRFMPRREQSDLALSDVEVRPVYSREEIKTLTQPGKRERFPEAVVPRSAEDLVEYDIVKSPRYKKAKTEEAVVKDFADQLEAKYKQYENEPRVRQGRTWYSDFVPMVQRMFGNRSQEFVELLAATSPRNTPKVNFNYAVEAFELWQSGAYDGIISKFKEGLEKLGDGRLKKEYRRANKRADEPTPAAQLAWWIEKHDLIPKRANGKLFGMNSTAVLRVITRQWLNEGRGLKTHQFVKNLLGTDHGATIDMWAARTMREAGYKGFQDRWRILPENEAPVSDADFRFSQKVFAETAKRLSMEPDELQGALWFLEKSLWQDNEWGVADFGSYVPELKELEVRRRAPRQETFEFGPIKPKKQKY